MAETKDELPVVEDSPEDKAVWECFCNMKRDGQKIDMSDLLIFGRACFDAGRSGSGEASNG